MKKPFSYLAMMSCFVLGTTLAHADTDAHHGKMEEEMQEKMFKAMDVNPDGMVTTDEFSSFHAQKFMELDVNGNAQITLEEMKAGHKKAMDGSRQKKMDDAKGEKMDDSKMDSDSGKAHPPNDTAKPESETSAAGDFSNSCCWTPRDSDAN